jgi:hypothetical protein
MLSHRVFRVVVVREGHGVGVATEETVDKLVDYSGREVHVTVQ